jgi:hypothetical protein
MTSIKPCTSLCVRNTIPTTLICSPHRAVSWMWNNFQHPSLKMFVPLLEIRNRRKCISDILANKLIKGSCNLYPLFRTGLEYGHSLMEEMSWTGSGYDPVTRFHGQNDVCWGQNREENLSGNCTPLFHTVNTRNLLQEVTGWNLCKNTDCPDCCLSRFSLALPGKCWGGTWN